MVSQEQVITGYTLSDREFGKLCRLIYDTAGIDLRSDKKELVHSRLSKILRKRGMSGFKEYISILTHDTSGDELIELLNAISTNVTNFFRESTHFDFIARTLSHKGFYGNLRVWCAGCSSGEEPYSLAIILCEHVLKPDAPKPFILATDISTKVLGRATKGVYPEKAVDTVSPLLRKKYFLKGKDTADGFVRVKKNITEMVTFQRQNLIEPFMIDKGFDLILCRNVMIYFDRATREKIVNKFYDCLTPGGYFCIGHSESLNGLNHQFRYIQPTVYRKK